MRDREALEPAARRGRRLDQGDGPLRRRVVDDVELVVLLQDHALVRRTGIDIGNVFRAGLAELCERRALPVVTLLPDVPFAIRVEALQRIRPEADRRIEVVRAWIRLLLEDVLRDDPARAPADREVGMEARVRLLQLEHHGVPVGRGHAVDAAVERSAPCHRGVRHLRLDGVDEVVRGELDAVAPVDALTQLHRHLGEIVVVDRRLGSERVLPDAVYAGVGIDVPERVQRQLLETRGRAAVVRHPSVEP